MCRGPRSKGFSLVELLVALGLSALVATLGVAVVVSVVGIGRSLVRQGEMQQAVRSAETELGRALRTAGRGSLPLSRPGGPAGRGVALEVRSRSGPGEESRVLVPGWPGSPLVAAGSDVLVVRGVLSTPLYVVDYRDPTSFSLSRRRVRIRRRGPGGAFSQDLEPLRHVVGGGRGRPEALLLVGLGAETVHAVVEIVPGSSRDEGDALVLSFRTDGGELADGFAALSTGGRVPESLSRVVYAGILEEYRYFVRETGTRRTLSRARLYPGTEIPWGRLGGELKVDLAEGVTDLQVALGYDSDHAGGRFDSDPDASGADDRIVESPDGRDDDWLFNAPEDDPQDPAWSGAPPPTMHLVRVRLLSHSAGAGQRRPREALARLEDRVYGRGPDDPVNGAASRGRRRWISTLTVGVWGR